MGEDGDVLIAFSLDGTPLWTHPPEVVADWTVFAGTPFVENPSGQVVAVDPSTGAEAEVSIDLRAAAMTVLGDGRVLVDDASGTALLAADDGSVKIVVVPQCSAAQ